MHLIVFAGNTISLNTTSQIDRENDTIDFSLTAQTPGLTSLGFN